MEHAAQLNLNGGHIVGTAADFVNWMRLNGH
jgi:hypothetical protein